MSTPRDPEARAKRASLRGPHDPTTDDRPARGRPGEAGLRLGPIEATDGTPVVDFKVVLDDTER
ncbi:MAG TPA: hypothetical protein VFY71_07350 [Planctomycetota bacterium]|nr:hypothetical protein [Planctomycetota bacterium]